MIQILLVYYTIQPLYVIYLLYRKLSCTRIPYIFIVFYSIKLISFHLFFIPLSTLQKFNEDNWDSPRVMSRGDTDFLFFSTALHPSFHGSPSYPARQEQL